MIGPGDLAQFMGHERMYFGIAQASYPAVGDMPAYKADSARVATRAMRGDWKGAVQRVGQVMVRGEQGPWLLDRGSDCNSRGSGAGGGCSGPRGRR